MNFKLIREIWKNMDRGIRGTFAINGKINYFIVFISKTIFKTKKIFLNKNKLYFSQCFNK
jgi:hypothetical protein